MLSLDNVKSCGTISRNENGHAEVSIEYEPTLWQQITRRKPTKMVWNLVDGYWRHKDSGKVVSDEEYVLIIAIRNMLKTNQDFLDKM